MDESTSHALRVEPLSRDEVSFRAFREKYLFNPFGLSREHSESQFKAIRYIDRKLSAYSWYQGLSVFGSTMYGYSRGSGSEIDSVSASDIDIVPVVNVNDTSYVFSTVREIIKQTVRGAKRHGVTVHLQGPIDSSRLSDTVQNREVLAQDVNMDALVVLSQWTTQNGTTASPGKIGIARQRYRQFLKTLSPQVRGTIKRNLVDRLVSWDLPREATIEGRIDGYKGASHDEKDVTKRARQELWSRRVESLFGL